MRPVVLIVAFAAVAWAAPPWAQVLRNGAVELRRMTIGESDVVPLAAFLRALDEDYE